MGNADKKPLISVIVPVYKVELYLHACVDSILAQTYTNLEIILVDDGSPDNCPAICDEYAVKDQRVRVIHKENGGVSSSRNKAIDICTGEYLTFVDSDDTIAPDWLESLYKSIGCYDFVISGITYIINGKQTSTCPSNTTLIELVKSSLLGYSCNKLYRKTAIGSIRFLPLQREDIIFNLSLLSSGKTFTISNYCGYRYLQRESSLLHATKVPSIQALFDFENAINKSICNMSAVDCEAIYNCAVYSFVTDYIYKALLSDKLSKNEKKKITKQVISYTPFKKQLKKKYADNTLYRLLYLSITLKAACIVRLGFKLCQNK